MHTWYTFPQWHIQHQQLFICLLQIESVVKYYSTNIILNALQVFIHESPQHSHMSVQIALPSTDEVTETQTGQITGLGSQS